MRSIIIVMSALLLQGCYGSLLRERDRLVNVDTWEVNPAIASTKPVGDAIDHCYVTYVKGSTSLANARSNFARYNDCMNRQGYVQKAATKESGAGELNEGGWSSGGTQRLTRCIHGIAPGDHPMRG